MANIFHVGPRPDSPSLQLNNSWTSLLIDVLSLAASDLAQTSDEIEWASWISSHDQNTYGNGIVGFDILDMPWSRESPVFARQLEFARNVIAAAKDQRGWDRLSYVPQKEMTTRILDEFAALFDNLTIDQIPCVPARNLWPHGKPEVFELCPAHRVYRHIHGCVLCP